ncbi:MAG: tRNA-dihydrouridine synthase family protein, partial [Clostridia bacterium]|nr:tRNA-dihydrouridine synthase family protein [Clostridia bacterium]
MAGVADRAFRELCVSYGAAYVVSEMISSKGVSMGDRKSKDLMFLSEEERPAAVQIFGNDPRVMAESIDSVMKVNPQIIDINMGCPAAKISGNGGGASLAKNPQLAEEIVKAVVNASPVPVTVKIRAGWDENSINAVEMAQRAENAGASAITIHGRTKKQMYAPPVDRNIIAEVKKAVSIPVIGNGDIVDGLSAASMLEDTNCDLIMIGRGALGCP